MRIKATNIKQNKFILYMIVAFIIFYVVCMTVGAFFDKQIDSFLYNNLGGKTGVFSKFIQNFSFYLLYIVPTLTFIIFSLNVNCKGYYVQILLKVVFLLFSLFLISYENYVCVFFMRNDGDLNYNDTYTWLFAVGIAIPFILFAYFAFKRFDRKILQKLTKFSIMAIFTIFITFIIVTLLKASFPRPRFNKHIGDTSAWFIPWYLLQWKWQNPNADPYGNTSFPSGHVVSACAILCFVFLPFIFKNLFNKKCIALCIFLPILLILTVAFGRMAGGYHFLSDVSTSLIICFVFSSLFFYLFFYNQNLSLIIENKIIKNNLFTNGIIILLMLGLLVYIYFA